jgi:hypothetical protein
MPWVRQNGKHVFITTRSVHITSESTSVTSAPDAMQTISTSTGGLIKGVWCQYKGIPEGDADYWLRSAAQGKLENVHSQIELAEPGSTCVAGVVVGDNVVKTDGVVLAYVIKKKRTLDLSGLYATSENGLHVGDTAIIARDNFFVMARSKDDQVEKLTAQFAELTG